MKLKKMEATSNMFHLIGSSGFARTPCGRTSLAIPICWAMDGRPQGLGKLGEALKSPSKISPIHDLFRLFLLTQTRHAVRRQEAGILAKCVVTWRHRVEETQERRERVKDFQG
jgi:hypothetical protein